jgi:TonB-linked SusC/RagA family outer membrane protein
MNGIVTGRVTAAGTGEALVGVTVTVVGTRLGSITADDGRYTIANVPDGTHLLYARRLGFGQDSQTVVVVTGQTVTANFALRAVGVQLSPVVAIGYGTQARRELTGSVASVSSEQIRTQPVQNVEQAIQGRAPGVQVTEASGQPGAPAAVRIRGGNSISAGNEPLYVIDGVPVQSSPNGANTTTLETQGVSGLDPLASLNPQDIASVDILKDASATAIYGARAANGVILITTKRGRAGANTVNFGAYYGDQEVRHKLSLLNAQQFAQIANQARTNAGQPALYTQAQIDSIGTGIDWQSAIFRSAPVANYDLSFAGGSETTRYYLSGNLLQQQGVVLNTNLNRGSVRFNIDQAVNPAFRVGTRFTLTRSQGQVMPNGGGGQEVSSVLLNALTAPPTIPIKGSGGEYFVGLNAVNGRTFANPVASAELITNREQQNRLVGNAFGEYDILRNLTFRASLGADYLSDNQDFYSPSTTYPGVVYGGYGSRGSLQVTTWLNENTLHYTLGQVGFFRALDLLGGVTFQRTLSDNVSGTAENFVTDALAQNGLNTGATYVGVWTGAPHSSLESFFARVNWNFLDRYLFTVTARDDGSSKFGSGNRWGFFPSAALAWRLSDEPILHPLTSHLDDLKLRVSYGRTGNQDIGNYAALATLGSGTYLFNNAKVIGYAPDALPNPNLKWETTDQFDAGIDAGVLRNRLMLTADYYAKRTNGLLLNVAVPATLGFTSQLQNIGSVSNKGFELGLNTVNLAGRFGWTTSLNLTWNRNRVLGIGSDTIQIAPVGVGAGANQNPTVLKVGQPINSFYGYIYDKMVNGQPTYRDLNGDNQVTTADQTIIGNAQPNYTGGFINNFTLGRFDLTVFLQFSQGNKIYNITRALLTNNAGNGNQLTDVLSAGSTGANGIPEAKLGNSYDTRPSTLFVEDGSYLRGKNLRLAFTLPNSVLAHVRIGNVENAQLYASIQNFFTATHYTGFDPEVSEYATSVLAQGIDFGTYPQTRQFTIGFSAGF